MHAQCVACRGKAGDEYYHIFRNVRVQWIGTGELGVVFFYPADEPQPEDKRVTRVWFTHEVWNTASIVTSGHLRMSIAASSSCITLSGAHLCCRGQSKSVYLWSTGAWRPTNLQLQGCALRHPPQPRAMKGASYRVQSSGIVQGFRNVVQVQPCLTSLTNTISHCERRCQENWVNKPAIVFHTPYPDSTFHMVSLHV